MTPPASCPRNVVGIAFCRSGVPRTSHRGDRGMSEPTDDREHLQGDLSQHFSSCKHFSSGVTHRRHKMTVDSGQ
jgi:hypothetical protein